MYYTKQNKNMNKKWVVKQQQTEEDKQSTELEKRVLTLEQKVKILEETIKINLTQQQYQQAQLRKQWKEDIRQHLSIFEQNMLCSDDEDFRSYTY
jgi:hypothetical protein